MPAGNADTDAILSIGTFELKFSEILIKYKLF